MKIEEYKTIRSEMLNKFRWTFEIIFFSVVSTSAIISWLATRQSQTTPIADSPYLFILIGSGIVAYLFWLYYQNLRSIYNQGGYLVVFHELEKDDLMYHAISRFKREIRGLKSNWGVEGKDASKLLLILLIANGVGPLYFSQDKIMPSTYFGFFGLTITIILYFLIFFLIFRPLRRMEEFMHENLKVWFKVKENWGTLLADNKKIEEKLKHFLDC